MKFQANCEKYIVKTTQIGLNTSQVNNEDIGVKKSVIARHDDTVNFLSDQYKFKIIFNPPPATLKAKNDDFNVNPKKQKSESGSDEPKSKRMKSDVDVGAAPWFDDSLGKVVAVFLLTN